MGRTVGATNLLSDYHGSQSAIAEAYIKGEICEHLEPFVLQVIGTQHLVEARKRLNRKTWRLEERVMKLEEEVKALQALVRTSSTINPYQPRSLPRR